MGILGITVMHLKRAIYRILKIEELRSQMRPEKQPSTKDSRKLLCPKTTGILGKFVISSTL